ncbi:hypothetical protein DGWBC_1596 [Dehalogenimonas sp. WBC-2]|nr:hypothetical protein DGWBC_1596 [Dehalogenimonas sp. WBC-2]
MKYFDASFARDCSRVKVAVRGTGGPLDIVSTLYLQAIRNAR